MRPVVRTFVSPARVGAPIAAVACGLGLWLCPPMTASESGQKVKVKFWADDIEVTGSVSEPRVADRLLIALHRAQPGRQVMNRLTVDPSLTAMPLPETDELESLALELALSTRDGCLMITDREVVVSGLTDSHVTHAAFEARLRPMAARHPERQWRNRICLVPEEDLAPENFPPRPRPALNPQPLDMAPVMLADSAYGPGLAPLRATPLAMTPEGGMPSPLDPRAVVNAEPGTNLELIERIQFATDSYLVAYSQAEFVGGVLSKVRALPDLKSQVVLRGYPDTAGSHTYNDWLSLSRAKAVRRALVDAGIPEGRIRLETPATGHDRENLGSVRVFLPLAVPPKPEIPPAEPVQVSVSASASPDAPPATP